MRLDSIVISNVIFDPTAGSLAKLFMEQVVLSFGMVAVIVVDSDSKFKSLFEKVCSILKITFWPLARGNHKANSTERYHGFINKTPSEGSAFDYSKCAVVIVEFILTI